MSSTHQAPRAGYRLATEKSLYLRQHASNPVDWYPWGSDAFAKARAENKPILLSVGYSSCHWCHVMAQESFEDDETAHLMNKAFVNIKVDREERPDVDEVYMAAVQAMTRRGGWPLTAMLTPEGKPFFGGTYFPPDARQGIPSFRDVLMACASYFVEKREELEERADALVASLAAVGGNLGLAALESRIGDRALSVEKLADALLVAHTKALAALRLDADVRAGGFGGAPKFMQPSKIELFLWSEERSDLAHAVQTLKSIRAGGITDQVGGGLARYAVDASWTVPHFEKMLYDNAQCLPLFATASAALAGQNDNLAADLADMADAVVSYLERDVLDASVGLFTCAEDADSEGEEGRFYVFESDEFEAAFAHDEGLRTFAKRYFGVSKAGNFEGANVLTCPQDTAAFAAKRELGVEAVREMALRARERLLDVRSSRERPARDPKCLLGWNALVATGLLRSGVALARPDWIEKGVALVARCKAVFRAEEGYRHTYCDGETKIGAFADDLAFFMEACVEVACLTGCSEALEESLFLAKELHRHCVDPAVGTLYFAARSDELLYRPTRPEDNVLPSAHSSALFACETLKTWAAMQGGEVLGKAEVKMLEALSLVILSNVANLAEDKPLACTKSLLWVKWMATRAAVLVSPASPGPTTVPFEALVKPVRVHAAGRRGKVLVGVPVRPGTRLLDAALFGSEADGARAAVTFAYCDVSGCQLPTNDFT
ncbi:MAG: thioredoxin domain-containing protein [Silvanigrellales bacterium]|nr:thioredoxin domain-containing protein [Silvanigrellales bacterium]